MTDSNKIKFQVETEAAKSLGQLEKFVAKVEEAKDRVIKLERALQKMYGVQNTSQITVAQRRAGQIAQGGPETIATNAYRIREQNRQRATSARVILEAEQGQLKTMQAKYTLFERYLRMFNQYERALERQRRAEATSARTMTAEDQRRAARANYVLQERANRMTERMRDSAARTALEQRMDRQARGTPMTANRRQEMYELAMQAGGVTDPPQASASRAEQAKQRAAAQRDLQQLNQIHQQRLRQQEEEIRNEQELAALRAKEKADRREQIANNQYNRQQMRQFNRIGSLQVAEGQTPRARARIFMQQLQEMRQQAAAEGRILDELAMKQRFREMEAARMARERRTAAATANRQDNWEANRPENARRSILTAQDRMRAYGGAGIFAVQGELLRNYALMGGAMGAGGFLGNFAVQFEKELANLQAIAAATDGEMKQLLGTFVRLAQASKFSAQEIVQGSVLLAQAGFSASDIDKSVGSIMRLATATGTDFATAVDVASSTISIFSLQTGEAERIADTLTEAMNRSKLGVEQFRLGLQYAGNIAADQGLTYQELTAALAGMANQGIRSGSTLGTGLRQMLIDLQNPTAEARAHFEALGLSMSDLDVRTNGLFGVLRNLQSAGFTSADALQTFEVRAAAAFSALNANLPAVEALREGIQGTSAATDAASTQMDTLAARFTQFANSVGIAFASVVEPIQEMLKVLLQALTQFFSIITAIAPVLKLLIPPFLMLGFAQMGVWLAGLVKGFIAHRKETLAASGALAGQARQYNILQAAAEAYYGSLSRHQVQAGQTWANRAQAAHNNAAGSVGQSAPLWGSTSAPSSALTRLQNELTEAQEARRATQYALEYRVQQMRELMEEKSRAEGLIIRRYREQYNGGPIPPGGMIRLRDELGEDAVASGRMTREIDHRQAVVALSAQLENQKAAEAAAEQKLAAARAAETAATSANTAATQANTAAGAANTAETTAQTGAINGATAATSRWAVAQALLRGAMAGIGAGLKAMGAAFVAMPFTSFMIAIGVLTTGLQLLDMWFESPAEKADKLNTEIAQLQGTMDGTSQSLIAVRDAMQTVQDRSVGITDETRSLEDRQRSLQDVVSETTTRFADLTQYMDGQITTIGELRAAMLAYEADLNRMLLAQARTIEQQSREAERAATGALAQEFQMSRNQLGMNNPLYGAGATTTEVLLRRIRASNPREAAQLQELFGRRTLTNSREDINLLQSTGSSVRGLYNETQANLRNNSLSQEDRNRATALAAALEPFIDRLDRMTTLAAPIIDQQRNRIANQPQYVAGLLAQSPTYSANVEALSSTLTNFTNALTAIQETPGSTLADVSTRISELQQTPEYRQVLEQVRTDFAAAQEQAITDSMRELDINRDQAERLVDAQAGNSELGRALALLTQKLERDPFAGAPNQRSAALEGLGNVSVAEGNQQIAELMRLTQGANRPTLEAAMAQLATLNEQQIAEELAKYRLENNVNPDTPGFRESIRGRAYTLEEQRLASEARTRVETLQQNYGRNDRSGGSRGEDATKRLLEMRARATKEEIDSSLQTLGRFNDPAQIQTAQREFEERFAQWQQQRIELFGRTWDTTEWANPAEAEAARDLALGELNRELAAQLEQGRRRLDDALIQTVIERMELLVDNANRAFSNVQAEAQFSVDRLDGLRNRGRTGDSRRAVAERRAEVQVNNALPANITAQVAALAALQDQMVERQAALAAADTPERREGVQATITTLQSRIDSLNAEIDDLKRQAAANDYEQPRQPIFNEGGGFGLDPDFTSGVADALKLWQETSGVLKDAADAITDGIVNAFDTLNTSMKSAVKDVLLGTASVEDAVKQMAYNVLESLLDMAIEMATNQLINWALSFAMSMFGKSGAGGTPVTSVPGIGKKAQGGTVKGGIPNRDSVPTLLMPDEYVMRKSAADMIGRDTLDKMNATGRVAGGAASNVVPMMMKRDPDTTNVWVVSPDQKPQFGPKDVIVTIQSDVARSGPMKKLIRQVAMGG